MRSSSFHSLSQFITSLPMITPHNLRRKSYHSTITFPIVSSDSMTRVAVAKRRADGFESFQFAPYGRKTAKASIAYSRQLEGSGLQRMTRRTRYKNSAQSLDIAQSARLVILPGEILNLIYAELPDVDLLAFSSTCRKLYQEGRLIYFATRYVAIVRPNYERELRRLQSSPPMVKQFCRNASVTIGAWGESRSRVGLTAAVEYIHDAFPALASCTLLYKISYQDIKPDSVGELWMQNMLRQTPGQPSCDRLILYLVTYTSNPCHPLLDWVEFCNRLALIVKRGSTLKHLEVWLPGPRYKRPTKPRVTIEHILNVLKEWNANARCGHLARINISRDDSYWILALSIVRGLITVKVREYGARKELQGRQTVRTRKLEGVLQDVMLSNGQNSIPQFTFRYEHSGGVKMPWVQRDKPAK